MSIFKSQWVILKIKKLESKNNLYTIFTSDYWKIICNKKISNREKTLDLGYLINFEIEVKKWVNIFNIKNIKILSEFESIWKSYSIINLFLETLNIVLKKLPEKLINLELYNTLKEFIKYNNLTSSKIILTQLKILNILGILNLEHKNLTIKKILFFIHKNKINNVLKLVGISEKLEVELANIVKKY